MSKVVAVGELLIDFVGGTKNGDVYPSFVAFPGGAPANFAATLAKYGTDVSLISKVGDDMFGKMLIKELEDIGVDVSGITVTGKAFTTLAFVKLDSNGEREFSFSRKPGADSLLDINDVGNCVLENTKILHFGSFSLSSEPSRLAVKYLVKLAKLCGSLISYDPNLREGIWKSDEEMIKEALWGLGKADIVKISDNEVKTLFGLLPEQGCDHIFNKYGVSAVFVTCGENGVYYKTERTSGFVPSLESIEVKDTTGAGDIFTGALVHMLLMHMENGKELYEIEPIKIRSSVEFAVRASGLSAEKNGGIPSIPMIEEINNYERDDNK